uniref:Uncharacterized protein n=1 Tax=Helicotheca tamesis TaxID=374047 RepID=A0A7S2MZP4_9STRA|mmetsp:Transcript_6807/g.9190  ORF Transcript_6807/g.9190 Transcript_6807/m.9190 type:complete len:413 (+) Transcript_6807:75-1313(+)|eukprot:CAMPEP_0185725870 /NCGR_PEP_ID=MMETSP1171-20130828/2005_1 /TAXON_ID=374046 /ORGANISM="Helicotheca tamensis, Strain CCMP826" /LENGTH=412 /DNA_ID=CAMNT_0028394091 /DNA_START=51 /DNA_END=1290 /DNA_ORIENTATION=-
MRLSLSIAVIIACHVTPPTVQAFTSSPSSFILRPAFAPQIVSSSRLYEGDDAAAAATESPSTDVKRKKLGLITFDLDDTLYPIAPVISEANDAFAKAMSNFGFDGIKPSDIDETGRQIREEIAAEDPAAAAALSHTEIRMMAIRRQMETVTFLRTLEDVADDWATPVSSLSPIIVQNAKKWASKEVSPSVVQAVYNAWEMERHHSGERHIYPDLLDTLKKIKEEHPGVVIGAVTDGKANPMLMTFTLAPLFDFCMSWEDDQSGRRQFFKELSETESDAQLKWIYESALDKYRELTAARSSFKAGAGDDDEDDVDDRVWIHVGDDLAYDVGGSHACGAKTILAELADKYEQTARHRFSGKSKLPSWSMNSKIELRNRKKMNDAAEGNVDKTVSYITALPEAINEILEEEAESD